MPVLLATNMAVPDWMMIKIDNLSGFSRWSPCANDVYNTWTQKTILSSKKTIDGLFDFFEVCVFDSSSRWSMTISEMGS